MKNKFKAAIVFGCFAVLMTSCASSISGQLRTNSDDVVASPDARVNITRLDAGSSEAEKTVSYVLNVDRNGSFATSETLGDGNYLIEALVPGYKITSTRIALSGSKSVEMIVVPQASAKAETIKTNDQIDMSRGSGGATLMPPGL